MIVIAIIIFFKNILVNNVVVHEIQQCGEILRGKGIRNILCYHRPKNKDALKLYYCISINIRFKTYKITLN